MSSASSMFFAVLSLRNTLGVPPTKIPIGSTTFVSFVFPLLVCYIVAAVLAVTPQTRNIRVALWPLVALLALRAALSVDFSFGKAEQEFNNTNFVLFTILVTARSLDWALSKGPFVRHLRPANSSPSTIMDAIDLGFNFRGHGWESSNYRSYTPRETRPPNRMAFMFYTLLSGVAHALICGVFHRAILTWAPMGIGSIPDGSTIFDESLPFPVRYFRAGLISAFTSIMIYSVMQMSYDFYAILSILVLGQDPAQWPPAFDAPWRATSLSDFWGRRWHQFLRHVFLLGGYTLYPVFGRVGTIIGTFLASAIWHHIVLVTINSRVEIWRMPVGFGMMGVGVLTERAFRQLTGKRVGGTVGWLWAMMWLLVWGSVIVEGFARAGMFGYSSPLDSATPLRALVERLAIDLDVWLHNI